MTVSQSARVAPAATADRAKVVEDSLPLFSRLAGAALLALLHPSKEASMFSGIRRVGLIAGAGILAVALSAAPVAAYSRENWQVGFAGTASGGSFGFWGWCAFAGGVNSGNDGDCQFSQYIHSPQFWVTCEVSLDITSWTRSHDFLFTGHASVNPSSLTGPCVSLFPGSVNFTNADSGIPGAAGHYHLNGAFGPGSELQIQVTQVP